jgi:N-acetylmuramate 1-kinase
MDSDRLRGFLESALDLTAGTPIHIQPLGGRGSDRTYYRAGWGDTHTAIVSHYDERRVENGYFADIGRFLEGIGIPVPHIIAHDPQLCLILSEDLGAADLYTLRGTQWELRSALYRKALLAARDLHRFPVEALPKNIRLMEGFGLDLYRWEGEYFLEHFVGSVCGIHVDELRSTALDQELRRLSESLLASPVSLVHRDLQSQNVMVRDGEIFFIDFQGMREGNAYYDLGSLLFDPYVDFGIKERMELIAYYHEMIGSNKPLSATTRLFHAASAQRLMQALGAYGFLGLKKGLSEYLDHVPSGLRNLTAVAEASEVLPTLSDLCRKCHLILQERLHMG